MGELWRWNGYRNRSALEPLSTILPGNYCNIANPTWAPGRVMLPPKSKYLVIKNAHLPIATGRTL
jgi:hypothetical protein